MKSFSGQSLLRSVGNLGRFKSQQCLRLAPRELKHRNRLLHTVPLLTRRFREDGSLSFLSPRAAQTAWIEYQQWLVDNINRLTQGTKEANAIPKDIALRYARNPHHAALFNYASMAHNNDFFFRGIASSPTRIPDHFAREIENAFSSVESLRTTFIHTADTMFGPGFVWLVYKNASGGGDRSLTILNTYIAGSPYAAAHWRRQPEDLNVQDNKVMAGEVPSGYLQRNPEALQYGLNNDTFSARARSSGSSFAPGAAEVEPILCVNTWPHVYLEQFGVTGKKEFLETWWDHIDWIQVAQKGTQPGKPQPAPFSRRYF